MNPREKEFSTPRNDQAGHTLCTTEEHVSAIITAFQAYDPLISSKKRSIKYLLFL